MISEVVTTAERKALAKLVTLTLEETKQAGTVHRPRTERRYVVQCAGEVLGHVFERTETMERKTPGRCYVNARWERECWGWSGPASNAIGYTYGSPCRSRIEAVAALFNNACRDGGRLDEHRRRLLKQIDKATRVKA